MNCDLRSELLGIFYKDCSNTLVAALSKCFVAVGNIEGVVGSKHQVPSPARGLIVKSNVE